jgi:urease accessory protein
VPESGTPRHAPHTPTGWQAELDLRFAPAPHRTILTHRRHLGPLRVQRPFYPEGETCHVYLIHPPGGVVGGDRLDIRIGAARGAQALVTTPAAGKFYRSAGAEARQTVDIALEGARFEWLPQETIFYRGSRARLSTRIRLDDASRMIAWEIGCLGLPARAEPFTAGRAVQSLEVWNGDRPLLQDRLRLDGGDGMMQARWGLAGLPVIGTLAAYPVTGAELEALRAAEVSRGDDGRIGLTAVDGLLVCRCIDAHADAVMRRFIALWTHLRPGLMGRSARPPRIWAT